ncbi:hypothetical protein BMS3Abin03_00855 [bacterium BMS3Abin03]|nr:hypothetical protein BMS3Abin03_00855 [bacterium BMS3Abin03]
MKYINITASDLTGVVTSSKYKIQLSPGNLPAIFYNIIIKNILALIFSKV